MTRYWKLWVNTIPETIEVVVEGSENDIKRLQTAIRYASMVQEITRMKVPKASKGE